MPKTLPVLLERPLKELNKEKRITTHNVVHRSSHRQTETALMVTTDPTDPREQISGWLCMECGAKHSLDATLFRNFCSKRLQRSDESQITNLTVMLLAEKPGEFQRCVRYLVGITVRLGCQLCGGNCQAVSKSNPFWSLSIAQCRPFVNPDWQTSINWSPAHSFYRNQSEWVIPPIWLLLLEGVLFSEFPELCGVEQEIVNRKPEIGNRFIEIMKNYELRVQEAWISYEPFARKLKGTHRRHQISRCRPQGRHLPHRGQRSITRGGSRNPGCPYSAPQEMASNRPPPWREPEQT